MANLKTEDGVSIYYEHHLPENGGGPADVADSASKPTVIFSCAYCTTHENWRGQVEPLVAAGHPVVLWDLRGHGNSGSPEGPDDYSIEWVVADLYAVAEATTPGQPFVAAGLSFGGLASLHFAVRHPDRVAALALIDAGPGFKNPEAAAGWAAQVERTANFLETRGLKDFVEGRAGTTCIGAKSELPAARAAAAAICAQSVPGLARFGREVSGLAPSVIDDLASLDMPALVVVGENDKPFLRAAEVMAAKLPRSHHVVIAGAGHIVNIEEAEIFNREMLDFLSTLTEVGSEAGA
ncbi:MAG TPA: alpha/beta fold hydrolase [Myxococcales bacterium]|nr:alpha/beta fold hydrolase [Myxococcales bacterium]